MEQIFIGLACVIHLYIFALESLLWGRPRTNKAFGMSADAAAQNRLFAFNQGFYNLFLALSSAAGLALAASNPVVANTLKAYACSSMLGASLVLLVSNSKLWRPALVQGVPPLLGLIALALRAL